MNMNYYLQAIGFIHDVTKDENMVIGQTYDGATMLTGGNDEVEVVVTIKEKAPAATDADKQNIYMPNYTTED